MTLSQEPVALQGIHPRYSPVLAAPVVAVPYQETPAVVVPAGMVASLDVHTAAAVLRARPSGNRKGLEAVVEAAALVMVEVPAAPAGQALRQTQILSTRCQ
jgi:hypothetical protein